MTNQQTRIGVLGGTFDPVHLGHLMIAEQAHEHLNLSEVRWIPAATAPHEQLKNASDSTHRLAMVQLAISGNSNFICDDREVRRGGKSYTIDTLHELKSQFPNADLVFLMGADSLREFSKWRMPSEICKAAQVVVIARGGQPAPDLSSLNEFLPLAKSTQQLGDEHLLNMPQFEVSSSDIRRRVALGKSIRYMVPAAVEAYIRQHNLYRS